MTHSNGDKINCLVIDGNSLLHRSYHGAINLTNGEYRIGGIFQFLTYVRKILNERKFDKVVVFFDGEDDGYNRRLIVPEYKSKRKPKPEDFIFQKERLLSYLENLFIRTYSSPQTEADDCIAYYAQHTDENVLIVSNDGDLLQLIKENVWVLTPTTGVIHSKKNFTTTHPYLIENIPIIKAISGCTSDEIPGVIGVGEKTLLKFFPELIEKKLTLEDIFSKIVKEYPKDNRMKKILNEPRIYDYLQIVDLLTKQFLKDEDKDYIGSLIEAPLDPENRDIKNVLDLMHEDHIIDALPGHRDEKYGKFVLPFTKIIEKEKSFYEQCKHT